MLCSLLILNALKNALPYTWWGSCNVKFNKTLTNNVSPAVWHCLSYITSVTSCLVHKGKEMKSPLDAWIQESNCAQVEDMIPKGRMSLKGAVWLLQLHHRNCLDVFYTLIQQSMKSMCYRWNTTLAHRRTAKSLLFFSAVNSKHIWWMTR